jgi:predicted membrane protein
MFTTGEMIFAASFLLVFIIGMFFAYKKDSFTDKIHFKGASKTLLVIILVFIAMFLFVKFRHRI